MSKIFEALQRAQQQTDGDPPAPPAVEVPRVAVSEAPPAAETPIMPAYSAPSLDRAGYGNLAVSDDTAVLPAEAERTSLWEEATSLIRFSPRSKAVVHQNPTSLAAEQYRVLRTNILKLSQTQPLKAVLVTSPGPGDGKTLTALNLALSFSQRPNTSVLLIEADLRKPTIGSLVAIEPGPGFSDYLAGEASLEQVVRHTSIPNFSLLDSGRAVRAPADLLNSPRFGSMMEAVRSHFNWIILDGPPTNPVADYDLLSQFCDGVVVVVRPLHTQRDLLRLTTEALKGRKVLGVVVNGSHHFDRYGGAYGYGYGYGPENTAEPVEELKKARKKKRFPRGAGE